jgi:hypothetical protein
MEGVAAVAVNIAGLPIRGGATAHEFELNDLPLQGSVRIGKKSVY